MGQLHDKGACTGGHLGFNCDEKARDVEGWHWQGSCLCVHKTTFNALRKSWYKANPWAGSGKKDNCKSNICFTPVGQDNVGDYAIKDVRPEAGFPAILLGKKPEVGVNQYTSNKGSLKRAYDIMDGHEDLKCFDSFMYDCDDAGLEVRSDKDEKTLLNRWQAKRRRFKGKLAVAKYSNQPLLKWQKDFLIIVYDVDSSRSAIWIYDPMGSMGKSWFINKLQVEGRAWKLLPGKKADLAEICESLQPEDPEFIIFDLQRQYHGNDMRSFLECLEPMLDGSLFKSKYHSRMGKDLSGSIKIVFSNTRVRSHFKVDSDRCDMYGKPIPEMVRRLTEDRLVCFMLEADSSDCSGAGKDTYCKVCTGDTWCGKHSKREFLADRLQHRRENCRLVADHLHDNSKMLDCLKD